MHWLLDVGYYGNNGIHLPGFEDLNEPAPASYLNCTAATPCFAGPVSLRRQWSQFYHGLPHESVVH